MSVSDRGEEMNESLLLTFDLYYSRSKIKLIRKGGEANQEGSSWRGSFSISVESFWILEHFRFQLFGLGIFHL